MAAPQELAPTGLEVSGLYIVDNARIWGAEPRDHLDIDFDGIAGDRHAGLTRTMQNYESAHLRGMTIANDKHVSLVSEDDMVEIAEMLGLDIATVEERAEEPIAQYMARRLAANMLITGAALNELATPGLILAFGDTTESVRAAIRITEYNAPCKKPHINLINHLRAIDLQLSGNDFEEQKERFKEIAAGRRGWVASTYVAGEIAVGNSLFSHRPVAIPPKGE